MTPAVQELRTHFEAALSDIASRTLPAERCIILSGGVDTCAILAQAKQSGMQFAAAITVLCGDDSPDKEFAAAAAAEHSIAHVIIKVTPTDLLQEYLPACVKLLNTFDGMTLRNSLVVAAAMRKAGEMGMKHAVVGDGADELFGGYSFMWGMADDLPQWKDKRDKMCRKWTFATTQLAGVHGITVHSPYTEPTFVAWALDKTTRSDCIGERPIRLTHGGETIMHMTGKVCLREAYETISSWRRKDPIEVGSGITIIGHDPFWEGLISDEELEAAKADGLTRGFVLKNKEHLANFRSFEQAFGRDGASLPTKSRRPMGEGCVGCRFEIGDNTFCEVCGAYPAQRTAAVAP